MARTYHNEEIKNYWLEYNYANDPESGFSFPCDEAGNVCENEMHPNALENLHKCRAGEYDVLTADDLYERIENNVYGENVNIEHIEMFKKDVLEACNLTKHPKANTGF